jgi:carbohydrate kinase (thermoresistant glucokinase family)
LKRVYRDSLKGFHSIPPKENAKEREILGPALPLQWIYLKGSKELIAKRIAKRSGHYMKPEMLDSQFAALEEPTEDEGVIVVDIDKSPEGIVKEILEKLQEKHKHITSEQWKERFDSSNKDKGCH